MMDKFFSELSRNLIKLHQFNKLTKSGQTLNIFHSRIMFLITCLPYFLILAQMTNLQILFLFQFLNYTPIEPWDNIESINYELRVYIFIIHWLLTWSLQYRRELGLQLCNLMFIFLLLNQKMFQIFFFKYLY